MANNPFGNTSVVSMGGRSFVIRSVLKDGVEKHETVAQFDLGDEESSQASAQRWVDREFVRHERGELGLSL
jgi:predicted AAA+ superfamily ATPase